jgi:iron complex transport system substrate-binding protein
MKTTKAVLKIFALVLLMVLSVIGGQAVSAAPVAVTDASGQEIQFTRTPQRVVSLVPTAAEILFALECQDTVAGITIHDTKLSGGWDKPMVGGYFRPSLKAIQSLNPDLIIAAPHHLKMLPKDNPVPILVFDTKTLADAAVNIEMFGRIFGKEKEAKAIIDRNRREIELIREKTNRIPTENHKRVIRLMGRGTVMTPGDDSYQNELIAAAGGIPPKLGKTGDIVTVTLEEWQAFNPQVIYGCGDDLKANRELLQSPGWKDVDAVRNSQMFTLPCDLTCRAATHTGYFAAWLASYIYTPQFADPSQNVQKDGIVRERPITVDLPYVKGARIVYSVIDDFENKSLVIDFKAPQTIVSTLDGQRTWITTVGNHFSPPPLWAPTHLQGMNDIRQHIYAVLGRKADTTSFLLTGADMDNVSVQTMSFKDMQVTALVTAGVESNAVRMSQDSGDFYEPGTINIIILTNMALSPRAMTRAVISATEGKTAALWDMDVRSTYTSLVNPATGTGTDEIIVVGGRGAAIENAGGHTKMGELIAKAVYAGVQEAVRKQNGLTPGRYVFDRLAERRISLFSLAAEMDCECQAKNGGLAALAEELLLDPKYAAFIESALALSDAYERGNASDLAEFHLWGQAVAEEIAGKKINTLAPPAFNKELPTVVREAFGYLFAGIKAREERR